MNDLDIFAAASEIADPEQRKVYLDKACGKDKRLRLQIEQLLEWAERSGSFMEFPAPTESNNEPQVHLEKLDVGAQIDAYRLKEKIGEGGMGVVYVAEQEQPVRRRVALKIIKPGMDSRQVLARFEAERQALAIMDHPNIAKVLDAGSTKQGLPYFVMELVNGLPINKYCDEYQLSIEERLVLFQSVCHGVQHAHQKGVIHRDLKPNNILVAEYDGKAVAKVIDFGVAKATGQALGDQSIYTQLGQIVGTLEYMSPEQAHRDQLDIDTRSDVYSLGVVLYELLTGELPFEKSRLRSVAIDELFRIIREEEPPKPSTRVSTSESAANAAKNRKVDPGRLGGLYRGELDWVVMKALEKDRLRRYETPSGLAQDIARHLANEPVEACPPSTRYRLQKFWRRNRTAATVFTTIASILIMATISSLYLAIWAMAAEESAFRKEQEAALAQQQAARSFALASEGLYDFLVDFSNSTFSRVPGAEYEKQRWLAKAVTQFETLVETNPDRLDLQSRYADILSQLGSVSILIADYSRAADCLTRCIEQRQTLLDSATTPDEKNYLIRGIINAFQKLAAATAPVDKELAEEHFRTCIRMAKTLSEESQLPEDHQLLAIGRNHFGLFLEDQGRFDQALGQYRLAYDSADPILRGGILHNLAETYTSQGQTEKALDLVDEALGISAQPQAWYQSHYTLKAKLHLGRQEYDDADAACKRAIVVSRRLTKLNESSNSDLLNRVPFASDYRDESNAQILLGLYLLHGQILFDMGNFSTAAKQLEKAEAMHYVLHGDVLIHEDQLESALELQRLLASSYEQLNLKEVAARHLQEAEQRQVELTNISPATDGKTIVFGGGRGNTTRAVVLADNGQFFVAGRTTHSADFDPGISTLSASSNGAFVSAYAENGSVRWVRSLGPERGTIHALTIAPDDSLIVLGAVKVGQGTDRIAFGDLELTVPEVGTGPIAFVVKMSDDGEVIWANWAARGTQLGALRESAVAIGLDGNVIVVGSYFCESQLGDDEHNVFLEHDVTGKFQVCGYVASYSSTGKINWARAVDSKIVSVIRDVDCDRMGSIYICGETSPWDNQTFANNESDRPFWPEGALAPKNNVVGFIAKLDRDGQTIWGRPIVPSRGMVTCESICVLDDGKVVLATVGNGPIDLDGSRAYENDFDHFRSGSQNANFNCWSHNGDLLWQRNLRGGNVRTQHICASPDGGIWAAIKYTDNQGIAFEGFPNEGDEVIPRTPIPGHGALLCQLDQHGDFQKYHWIAGERGSHLQPSNISVNQGSQVAVAGWFTGRFRTPTAEVIHSLGQDGFVVVLEALEESGEK